MNRKFFSCGALLLVCVVASSASAGPDMREAEFEVEEGLELQRLPDAGPDKYTKLIEVYDVARSEAVKLKFGDDSVIVYPSDDPLEFIDLPLLLDNPGIAELAIMAPEGVGIRMSNKFVESRDRIMMVGGEDGVTPNLPNDPKNPTDFIDPDGQTVATPQSGEIAWNGYVRISIEDGLGWCSGILIAPNLVLTAAHCTRTVPSEVQVGGTSDEWIRTENRYKVTGCKTPDDVVPSMQLGTHKKGDCGVGPTRKIRPEYDLAILSLERFVPPEQATPRSLMLSAQSDNIAADLMMFGYGYVAHTGSEPPECGELYSGTVVLAKSRQRMYAATKNRAPDQLSVVAKPPDGFSGAYGAVCGDSGGPLIMTTAGRMGRAGSAPRELVIGVLSRGNRADGESQAAALYHDKNRTFILSVAKRPVTNVEGYEVLNGLDFRS